MNTEARLCTIAVYRENDTYQSNTKANNKSKPKLKLNRNSQTRNSSNKLQEI